MVLERMGVDEIGGLVGQARDVGYSGVWVRGVAVVNDDVTIRGALMYPDGRK